MSVSFARVPCHTQEKHLGSGITVWYGNTMVTEGKSLLQVIKTAERIIGSVLHSTDSIHTQRCRTVSSNITQHTLQVDSGCDRRQLLV